MKGKTIPEYPNYLVFKDGRILNKFTKKYSIQRVNCGYKTVSLKNFENKWVRIRVHRLVAIVYLPNPNNIPFVNHKDGNKLNNCVNNLEWVTHKENMIHASKNNLLNGWKRPIVRLSSDGIELETFPSITSAIKKFNVSRDKIKRVCCNQTICAGYLWKYKYEKREIEYFDNEKWMPLKINKNYEISDHGRIKNVKRNSLIMSAKTLGGYLSVHIAKKTYQVHRLVIETFIGPAPENLKNPVCNHKDGNKTNNKLENLDWVSMQENVIHAYKTGLIKTKKLIQYTKTGEKVAEYNSPEEAAKALGLSHDFITTAANPKQTEHKTAGGFVLRYENIPFNAKTIKKRMRRQGKYKNVKKLTINQLTMDGEFIKEWNSIKDAADALGISQSCISDVCRKRKYHPSAGGYKWEYNVEY